MCPELLQPVEGISIFAGIVNIVESDRAAVTRDFYSCDVVALNMDLFPLVF